MFDLELGLTGVGVDVVETVWAVLGRQEEGLKWAWERAGSGRACGHGFWRWLRLRLRWKNKKKKKEVGLGGGIVDF